MKSTFSMPIIETEFIHVPPFFSASLPYLHSILSQRNEPCVHCVCNWMSTAANLAVVTEGKFVGPFGIEPYLSSP